jgi:hypothetical protein
MATGRPSVSLQERSPTPAITGCILQALRSSSRLFVATRHAAITPAAGVAGAEKPIDHPFAAVHRWNTTGETAETDTHMIGEIVRCACGHRRKIDTSVEWSERRAKLDGRN